MGCGEKESGMKATGGQVGTDQLPGHLPDPGAYEISQPCTHEELLAVAKVYARAVVRAFDLSVVVSDLSWEVSTRAKRRAGATTYRDGEPESIRLAWRQFDRQGWAATASTVRHELIHAHHLNEGIGPGHGLEFQRLAEQLETAVHCERFTEPEWWVHCTECDVTLARYRRSKLVSNPSAYQCGDCGGDLRVEAVD
jgi:SprT-like protein